MHAMARPWEIQIGRKRMITMQRSLCVTGAAIGVVACLTWFPGVGGDRCADQKYRHRRGGQRSERD